MNKALVLGASGAIGYALVQELLSRGVEVVAFARGKEKLDELYREKSKVTNFSGDVLVDKEISAAAEEVDVIFHAISFPYQEWPLKHLTCIRNIISVAETKGAKIALVDNIYAYGKQTNVIVTEGTEKNPHTKKGKIRLEMEHMLKGSHVPTLIVHMPDFYGPNARNTLFHETLKNVVQNKRANFIGSTKVAREYIYTKDGAKAMVELAFREEAYDQSWNIPSAHPITVEELIKIFREDLGYEKSIRIVTKNMFRVLGMFQPFMKEMVEMMYLTEDPVILSGKKYETLIGPIPQTPYREGIKETVNWIRSNHKGRLVAS